MHKKKPLPYSPHCNSTVLKSANANCKMKVLFQKNKYCNKLNATLYLHFLQLIERFTMTRRLIIAFLISLGCPQAMLVQRCSLR